IAEYYATAARFDPRTYDPRAWAAAARRAGMQYAVLTAKHHDGFALFDTRHSDFSARHAPVGRDLVRPFVDAMRAAGLRVGLYCSLSDWHHPDYPAFTDADRPYDFFALPQPTEAQWERYLAFLFAQVRELLTGYGPIDLLWFDGGWERLPPSRWRPEALRALIRSLQPDCLVNDRLPGGGDFETPEKVGPARTPAGPWETCLTMNESWGYNPGDRDYRRRGSSCTRSPRWRAAAATCSSTSVPWPTGGFRPSRRSDSMRSPAGWHGMPRPSSGRHPL